MTSGKSIHFIKCLFSSFAALLCLAACSNFEDGASAYFKKYGDIATVKSVSFDRSVLSSGGRYYVDSSGDLTIRYAIDNPGNFELLASVTGTGSEHADVTVESTTLISVKYPQWILAHYNCDYGSTEFDISPFLYIERASDNYGQSYDTQYIFCNSPPPDITNALGQIYSDAGGNSERLVVCFDLPSLPNDVNLLTASARGISHSFAISGGALSAGDESNGWEVASAAPGTLEATYDGGPAFSHAGGTVYYLVTDVQNLKSLAPFAITLTLYDSGGLSSSLSIPSHALKLDAPTCNDNTGTLFNELDCPYVEFYIYGPANASGATLHYTITDSSGNAVSDTSGSVSSHVGDALFKLYPKEDGSAETYTISEAYATKTGWLSSDDAAATFGNAGTVSVSGRTLDEPESSLADNGTFPQDSVLELTGAQGGGVYWTYSIYGQSGFVQGDDPSPASVTLEAAGNYTFAAYAHKTYYQSSPIKNFAYAISLSKVYVKSDGSDADGLGTMEKPYATLGKAVDAFGISGDSTSSANTIYVLDDMTAITSGIAVGSGYYNVVGCKGGTVGAAVKLNAASDGTIVQISGGTISLRALTITGNTNSSNGAVYVAGGTFIVKDKVVISGNATASGTASNVFLAHAQTITVDSGGLSGTSIGVSTATAPTGGNPVTITSGYSAACGTAAPKTYFTSDNASRAVLFDNAQTEAVIATGGGGIGVGEIYSVEFGQTQAGGVYTFTATATPTSGSAADVTDSVSSWSLRLYYLNSYTGIHSATNTVNLSSLSGGTYIMKITAVYGGKTYSGEVEVELP